MALLITPYLERDESPLHRVRPVTAVTTCRRCCLELGVSNSMTQTLRYHVKAIRERRILREISAQFKTVKIRSDIVTDENAFFR
jgi:hypothetical protein